MPQPRFNEDTLSERPAIEQLQRLGYTHVSGEKLDPEATENCERASRREVILTKRLATKLAEINPSLTPESIDKAVRKLTHINAPSTLEANEVFHKYLVSGVSIEQDIGARRQHITVHYIDFKNIRRNEFLAVNQFWVRGRKNTDKPDIVLFVNGIPLAVIECKSPVARNTGVIDAQEQLLRYQEEIPQLFRTNEILVGCNLFNAKYGAIEAPVQRYCQWENADEETHPDMADHPVVKEMLETGLIKPEDLSAHPAKQEILIAGVLKPDNLLDIVRNFIVFEFSSDENKVVKKICRYQQYTAVNKLVKRVLEEPVKRGIIWHWQGSGKSLVMVFAAMKLRREEEKLGNPKIVIITDRKKLDSQITDHFRDSRFPNPVRVNGMSQLYRLLSGSSGCTLMTTVQKFRKPLARPLSGASNIIVMTDEAHRTQYGSFALNMRNALPNAAFFAFTGTPLDLRDRNTYRHFSPPGERYMDRYSMQQAKEDKATVPIKYESRMANLQVVGASIDSLIRELFPGKTKQELERIKRRYATIEAIARAPRRIERVAMDIVHHYREKIAPNGFKAQIVAPDRETAVMYKKALDRLVDPSWSTVVMTVNNKDPEEWKRQYRRNATQEDRITGKEVFQNPDNQLQFLIVCDKLLTGFDAPIEQVMYLDQRMKEHTLLQAVARVNRPYARKNFGLVVDYAGIGRELAEALSMFDKEDLEGLFSVDDIKKELFALDDNLKKAIALFKGINRKEKPENIIQKCLAILEPDDKRSEFESLFRECARSVDILMPDTSVNPYLEDFKFLGVVREGAKNLYRDSVLDLENCSKKVEQLIHAHIVDAGIERILEPIDITAPDFEEKLAVKGSDEAKASHIEQAIRDTITAKAGEDPHFYDSLEKQLETIIEEDKKRRKDEAALLKELVKLGRRETRREAMAREKGLGKDEFAFYGLLLPHKAVLFGENDAKRCNIAKQIVAIVKSKLVIDWADKEDIRKEIRRSIKVLLRENGYSEENGAFDKFAQEILSLAVIHFRDYNASH